MTANDLPEAGETNNVSTNDKGADSTYFASLILLWAELILVMALTFIHYELIVHRNTAMYLVNQLMNFNNQMFKKFEDEDIQLDEEHKRNIRNCESVFYVTFILSLFLPIGILSAFFHPIEPLHVIINEWLEINFNLEMPSGMWPLLLLFLQAIYNEANGISIACYLVAGYFFTALAGIGDLIPDGDTEEGSRSSNLVTTRYYGEMDYMDVIKMYRTQQIFNLLLKEILGHATIAFHHVGLLAVFSVLFCFVIKFNEVLTEQGITAYLIVIGCLVSPLLLMYFQSTECGLIADISQEFCDVASSKIKRAHGMNARMFRKFGKSCRAMYIPVAYPFYNIDRSTFLAFCDQSLDRAIALMLW